MRVRERQERAARPWRGPLGDHRGISAAARRKEAAPLLAKFLVGRPSCQDRTARSRLSPQEVIDLSPYLGGIVAGWTGYLPPRASRPPSLPGAPVEHSSMRGRQTRVRPAMP